MNTKNSRTNPLPGLTKKSPMRNKFDFSSKKADYSKEKTSKTFGARLAKAITPENTIKGVISSAVPVGKAVKLGKVAYNYLKGDKA